jgi:heme exporter protein D
MNMNSLSSFLDMGGYAGFVWPSYGITVVVLVVLLVASLRSLSAREAALAELQGTATETGCGRATREA